jgi:hypothetical protein
MKTNYQKKYDENNGHVVVDKILSKALPPVIEAVGLGVSFIVLTKLHVPSKLVCDIIISVI